MMLEAEREMREQQIEAPPSRAASTTDIKQDPCGSRPQSFSSAGFGSIEVPTATPSVSSGFPYNQRLFNLHVPPAEWDQFSKEVVEALKLTTFETFASWTVGVSVGIVSALPLLVFGAAPGYYAGKAVKDKSILQKVNDYEKEIGELVAVLRRWNDTFFQDRGLSVKLAVPKKATKEWKAEKDGSSFYQKIKIKKSAKSPAEMEEKRLASHYRLVIGTRDDIESPDNASRGVMDGSVPSYSPRIPPAYKGDEPQELEGRRERTVAEAPGTQIYELA